MTLTAAKRPCGSCPYRRDVPSGIWEAYEYDKLVDYDGPTHAQPLSLFMCHQRDGSLCAGWLACHGTQGPTALLAMRMCMFAENCDPALASYSTDVPVFSSGAEAREHGLRDIEQPGDKAGKMIKGLVRKGF